MAVQQTHHAIHGSESIIPWWATLVPNEIACALMVWARAATPVCLIWLARPKLHRTDVGLPAWMEMGCPSAPRGIIYVKIVYVFFCALSEPDVCMCVGPILGVTVAGVALLPQ